MPARSTTCATSRWKLLKGKDLVPFTKQGNLLSVDKVVSIVAAWPTRWAMRNKQNVVHRDVKPANIMYEPESDVVKVTDFGIARITDSSKTKTGMVLGTPSYMSPEQLQGKKIDGRSDLFFAGGEPVPAVLRKASLRRGLDGATHVQDRQRACPGHPPVQPDSSTEVRRFSRQSHVEEAEQRIRPATNSPLNCGSTFGGTGAAATWHRSRYQPLRTELGTMTLSGALDIASCTDPGMVRAHNEDSIASDGERDWWCWPTAWAGTTRARWRAAWRRR